MSKYLDKEKPLIKSYINYIYFETIPELTAYIKEKHIYVCGVEIGETSVPIQNMMFKGDTLFILGNEGAGMNNKQKELCDDFVYIQQYTRKTGSLNVAIAASIIFHHFSIWAGY
jgi:tRNA G18 (ribose-2'-O)-methylase SpoU